MSRIVIRTSNALSTLILSEKQCSRCRLISSLLLIPFHDRFLLASSAEKQVALAPRVRFRIDDDTRTVTHVHGMEWGGKL